MRTGDFASAGPRRRLPSTTVRRERPAQQPADDPDHRHRQPGRRETIQSLNDMPLGQAIGMIALVRPAVEQVVPEADDADDAGDGDRPEDRRHASAIEGPTDLLDAEDRSRDRGVERGGDAGHRRRG